MLRKLLFRNLSMTYHEVGRVATSIEEANGSTYRMLVSGDSAPAMILF